MRLIVTFSDLQRLLAAEKLLRNADPPIACRVTPVPSALKQSICGMAIELLCPDERTMVVPFLQRNGHPPVGIHEIQS